MLLKRRNGGCGCRVIAPDLSSPQMAGVGEAGASPTPARGLWVLRRRGYDELQLTLVGMASLADQVPWNPMFEYAVPAAIEPS
jgi:hypothetical protein